MARISFDLDCEVVSITPNRGNLITVSLQEVDPSDLFDLFDAQEAIDHFGQKHILDQIGEDEVRKHFGIMEE